MIDGPEYVQAVRKLFSFLTEEYGITDIRDQINGNAYYDVQYHSCSKIISISYENVEDYLEVTVFKLRNGTLPDYDDKTQTLHLSALNKIVFSKADETDIKSNNQYFSKFVNAETAIERKLLKSAKELRLAIKFVEGVQFN